MNKYFPGLIIFIIVLLFAALGYFIFQNQRLIKTLTAPSPSPETQTQPSESSPSPSPKPSPSQTPTKEQLEANIKDAINSQNFAALKGSLTTPTVAFIIMSSECCQPQTPQEAISQLAYIEDGIPMDFNQENETVKTLKAKNPRLASAFVGISQSKEHTVAFTINQQNKISQVEVSVSWKLYDQ